MTSRWLGVWAVAVTVAFSAAVVARPAAVVGAASGTCTSVSLTTDIPSREVVGVTVNVLPTFIGCPDGPLYRYWVRYPDGTWRVGQDWSTNTFPWNTSGLAPGMYQLGIWIKDKLSTNTYDTYALESYQLTNPACTSVSISDSLQSPQAPGTSITFTASAQSCATPVYQWWVRDLGGNWSVPAGSDFAHSSSTFTWSTAGLGLGIYQIGVWVRDQQSTTQYDAYSIRSFEMGGTGFSCGGDLTTNASPQVSVGVTVMLDAPAQGCNAFMFWIRDPSGTWSTLYGYYVPIPYGSDATLQWDTSSVAPGTYLLGVWEKIIPIGTCPYCGGLTYLYYSITTVTVVANSDTCWSATVIPSVQPPQAAGAVISVGATAVGAMPGECSTPEFRFFIAPPGGGFVERQAYSPNSGFSWNTAGLAPGVYQLGVWARQQGSGSAYEAYAIVSYQLSG